MRLVAWGKRRLEILKRNLTWYEVLVITVMGPVLSTLFGLVMKALWEKAHFSVSDRLETIMIGTVLALTPIVLARIAYLLFFEKDRHQLPSDIDNPNVRFDTFRINTPESIAAVNALVRTIFPDTTIPDDVVTDILLKNRDATIGLYQRTGFNGKFKQQQTLVGCASCWPVTDDVYERMLANQMNEDEITAEHVLDHEQAKTARYFYVPVMLVRDWKEEAGRLQAAALLAAFLEHIRTTYANAAVPGRKIFFVGFTPEGISMAKRLGLTKREFVTQYGVTGREFYEMDLSAHAINELDRNERRILMRAIGLRSSAATA
ncbi:MAG TPA: hypothetical protein VG900_18655 [Hyphomicrobiaceae bacterium]|nr:hypothetical protein [Hyphomicrobiaceae bacterium]